jgi:hypothetical protein
MVVGAVWAQTTASYDLSWHVLSGGGREMTSPDHALRGTMGQVVIGKAVGDDYAASSGYWIGEKPEMGTNWLFMPVVVKEFSR